MTEDEWLACTHFHKMLHYLIHRGSGRKQRLFACSQARRIWSRFKDNESRHAIDAAEQYADGHITKESLRAAGRNAIHPLGRSRHLLFALRQVAIAVTTSQPWDAARQVSDAVTYLVAPTSEEQRRADYCSQSVLLRDILGNPFRPVTLNPAWLTPTVTSLATVAYTERALPSGELDTARLAVLADALEEAGCNNPDILGHLRSAGPHVRGCWAVDLLLGKE